MLDGISGELGVGAKQRALLLFQRAVVGNAFRARATREERKPLAGRSVRTWGRARVVSGDPERVAGALARPGGDVRRLTRRLGALRSGERFSYPSEAEAEAAVGRCVAARERA